MGDGIKIKAFKDKNNFRSVRNVVKDGQTVTINKTSTTLEAVDNSTVNDNEKEVANTVENAPTDPNENAQMSNQVMAMLEARTANVELLRRMLVSLSSNNLPELISKILTASEIVEVYDILNTVTTVKHELDLDATEDAEHEDKNENPPDPDHDNPAERVEIHNVESLAARTVNERNGDNGVEMPHALDNVPETVQVQVLGETGVNPEQTNRSMDKGQLIQRYLAGALTVQSSLTSSSAALMTSIQPSHLLPQSHLPHFCQQPLLSQPRTPPNQQAPPRKTPTWSRRARVDLVNIMGRCESVSLDDLEEITKKRRTKPTRASAEKGRKKTKRLLNAPSPSPTPTPTPSASSHSDLDDVNTDIDQVKEQVLTEKMKLAKQRRKQRNQKRQKNRHQPPDSSDDEENDKENRKKSPRKVKKIQVKSSSESSEKDGVDDTEKQAENSQSDEAEEEQQPVDEDEKESREGSDIDEKDSKEGSDADEQDSQEGSDSEEQGSLEDGDNDEEDEEDVDDPQPLKKRVSPKKKTRTSEAGEGKGRRLRKRVVKEVLVYSSDDESAAAKRFRALEVLKEKRGSTLKKSKIQRRPSGSDTDDENANGCKVAETVVEEGNEENAADKESGARKSLFAQDHSQTLSDINEEVYNWSQGDHFTQSLTGLVQPRKGRKIVSDTEDSDAIAVEDEEDSDTLSDQADDTDDSFVDKDSTQDNFIDADFGDLMETLKRRDERYLELNDDYELTAKGKQLGGGYDDSDDDELKENKYPAKLIESLREAHRDLRKKDPNFPDEAEQTNDEIINMWQMYQFKDLAEDVNRNRDQDEWDGECICSRTGLRYLFFMRIKKVENWQFYTRIVGSECIRWFCRGNPDSVLSFIQRVAREGFTVIFKSRLSSNMIVGTICGTQLPAFLIANREEHAKEHVMPLSFTTDANGKEIVDIKMRVRGEGRPRDKNGKHIIKGKRYRVHLDPVLKPNKDEDEIKVLEFIVRSMDRINQSDTSGGQANRNTTAKSYLK